MGGISCLVAQDLALLDQGSHSHSRGDFAPYRALFSVSCADRPKVSKWLSKVVNDKGRYRQYPEAFND
jgi:hypothetical protein